MRPFAAGYLVAGGYRIAEALPKTPGDRNDYYIAESVSTGIRVFVRRCIVHDTRDGEMRAKVKKWIDTVRPIGVARLLWTHVENNVLVELTEIPEGEPLEQWAKRRQLTRADIDRISQPLGSILESLQSNPDNLLLHLNINPRTLFVVESAPGYLTFTLAGLEKAVVIDGCTELCVEGFDLRYLPPEAAGAKHIEFNATSTAWDWWGLGRTIQEVMLGCHPFTKVPSATSSTRPLQKIMLGQDDRLRPGLVELMPETIDRDVRTLLEGLLTANIKARWGSEAFQQWGTANAPQTHYALGVRDPVFIFRGGPCTIAQAAHNIAHNETAAVAIEHALMPSVPTTLAASIKQINDPILLDHRKAGEAILAEPLANKTNPFSKDLRKQLAAAVILGLTANRDDQYLWIAGEKLDRAWIYAQVKNRRDASDVVAMCDAITAITLPSIVDRIRVAGFKGTADAFETVGQIIGYLYGVSQQDDGLVDLRFAAGVRNMVFFATKDPQELLKLASELQARFPVSRNSTISELLGRSGIDYGEAALLAMGIKTADPASGEAETSGAPQPVESYLLVSREEVRAQSLLSCREEGAKFAIPATYKMALLPMKWAPWTYGGFWAWFFFSGLTSLLLIDQITDGFRGGYSGRLQDTALLIGGSLLGLKIISRAIGWLCAMLWLRSASAAKGHKRLPFLGTRKHLFALSVCRADNRPKRPLSELRAEVEKANARITELTPSGTAPDLFELSHPVSVWVVAMLHGAILAGMVAFCVLSPAPHSLVANVRGMAEGPSPFLPIIGQLSKPDSQTPAGGLQVSSESPSRSQPSSSSAATWDHTGLFAPTEAEGMTYLKDALQKIAGDKNTINWSSLQVRRFKDNSSTSAKGQPKIEATVSYAAGEDMCYEEAPLMWVTRSQQFSEAKALLKAKGLLPKDPLEGKTIAAFEHKAGETGKLSRTWSIRADEKGKWIWNDDGAPTSSIGVARKTKPATLLPAGTVIAGTPEYATAKEAFLRYADDVIAKGDDLREATRLAAEFAPVQPGVSYSGLLRYNNENQGMEVRIVWDSFSRGGEVVTGFLHCVERPWVRKHFAGRSTRTNAGTVANVDIEEHWGSATFNEGVFSQRYKGSMEITMDHSGRLSAKSTNGWNFTITGERMPETYHLKALRDVSSKRSDGSPIQATRQKAIAGDAVSAFETARAAIQTLTISDGKEAALHEGSAWKELAYSLGDLNAGFDVVWLMLESKLGWRNTQIGMRLLDDLSDRRCAKATNWLGNIYAFGLYGTPVDTDRAFNFHRRAAELGDPSGMGSYGSTLLERSRTPEQEAEAAGWLRKGADAGDKWAQHRYALCLAKGWGVRRNPEEAAKYRSLSGLDEKGRQLNPPSK